VKFYNLLLSADCDFMYSNNLENLDVDKYTETRMNYIEELVDLFWYESEFWKDFEVINHLNKIAEKWGINFKSNYEMFTLLNKENMHSDMIKNISNK